MSLVPLIFKTADHIRVSKTVWYSTSIVATQETEKVWRTGILGKEVENYKIKDWFFPQIRLPSLLPKHRHYNLHIMQIYLLIIQIKHIVVAISASGCLATTVSLETHQAKLDSWEHSSDGLLWLFSREGLFACRRSQVHFLASTKVPGMGLTLKTWKTVTRVCWQ